MPTEPSAFGALLRRLRLAANLTQEELAERAGVSPNAIGALESGSSRAPKRGTLNALIEALRLGRDAAEAFRATAVGSALPGRDASRADPPTPVTPLIGRATEVAEVVGRLRGDVRLLALTGPGGIGKTRVARAAAERLGPAFRDGVWAIEIAALRPSGAPVPDAAERIAAAIAAALGVRESGTRRLADAVADHLRDRELLLVVENLEAAMAAAPLLDELLAAAPRVVVLVTSRESLRLPPAHEYPIGRLLGPHDAELFVARARAAVPDFAPERADVPILTKICEHLEGIPLAIELAAARIDLYPLSDLRTPLGRRLALLTGGPRTAPTRQWAMRAAIAWSEGLLDEDERALFRRLAIFAGGGTLAAAVVVCDLDGDAAGGIAGGVAELVAKSLLRRADRPGDRPRYAMLETIREYALERLTDSDEEGAMRSRHAAYFLALAEGAAPHLDGPEAIARLADLDREVDNLRAALDWLLAYKEVEAAEAAGRLVVALGVYWSRRGHLREGRRALERALTAGDALTPRTRAHALLAVGRLARIQYDPAAARAYLTDALARLQALGDEAAADALDELGIVAAIGGASDEALAERRFAEGLALARQAGDPARMARALLRLGNMAHARGDRAGAAARFEESLALLRGLDRPSELGNTLNNTALAAFQAGDLPRADALLAEALAMQREAGNADGTAAVLCSTGHAALARDDTARADALLGESLAIFRAIDNALGLARCLEGFAGIAAVAGDPRRAARLFGAAQALLDARGVRVPAAERLNYDRDLARARDALGADAFAAAYATGRGLPPDQVAAEIRTAGPDRPAR